MARIRNELSGLRVADGDLFQSMIKQLDALAGEITRTVGAIEDVFHRLAALAGGKGGKKGAAKSIDRIDAGLTLEGPQIDGPAISQADIDKLFN